MKLGIGFAYQPKNCKKIVLFQVEGDVCVFNFSFQLIIQSVPFGQHTKKDVFGTVRTEAYHRYIPPVYQYRTLQKVRYDMKTGTGHFGEFGTTSIIPLQ